MTDPKLIHDLSTLAVRICNGSASSAEQYVFLHYWYELDAADQSYAQETYPHIARAWDVVSRPKASPSPVKEDSSAASGFSATALWSVGQNALNTVFDSAKNFMSDGTVNFDGLMSYSGALMDTVQSVGNWYAAAVPAARDLANDLMRKHTGYSAGVPIEDQFLAKEFSHVRTPISRRIKEQQLSAGTAHMQTVLSKLGISLESSHVRKVVEILSSPAADKILPNLPDMLGLDAGTTSTLKKYLPRVQEEWRRFLKGPGFAADTILNTLTDGASSISDFRAAGEATLWLMEAPSYENRYLDSEKFLEGLRVMQSQGYVPHLNIGGASVFANRDQLSPVDIRTRVVERVDADVYSRKDTSQEGVDITIARDAARDQANKVIDAYLSAESAEAADRVLADAEQSGVAGAIAAQQIRGMASAVDLREDVVSRTKDLERVALMLRRVKGSQELMGDGLGYAAARNIMQVFGGSNPNGDHSVYADRAEQALFYASETGIDTKRIDSIAKVGAEVAQQNGLNHQFLGDALTHSLASFYAASLSEGKATYVDNDKRLAQSIQTTVNLYSSDTHRNLVWAATAHPVGDSPAATRLRDIQKKLKEKPSTITEDDLDFLSNAEEMRAAVQLDVSSFNSSLSMETLGTRYSYLEDEVRDNIYNVALAGESRGIFSDLRSLGWSVWQSNFNLGDAKLEKSTFDKMILLFELGIEQDLAKKVLSGTANEEEKGRVRQMLGTDAAKQLLQNNRLSVSDVLDHSKGIEDKKSLAADIDVASRQMIGLAVGGDLEGFDQMVASRIPANSARAQKRAEWSSVLNIDLPHGVLDSLLDERQDLGDLLHSLVHSGRINDTEMRRLITDKGAAFQVYRLSERDVASWGDTSATRNAVEALKAHYKVEDDPGSLDDERKLQAILNRLSPQELFDITKNPEIAKAITAPLLRGLSEQKQVDGVARDVGKTASEAIASEPPEAASGIREVVPRGASESAAPVAATCELETIGSTAAQELYSTVYEAVSQAIQDAVPHAIQVETV